MARKLLLALGSIVAFCLLAEGVVRLLGPDISVPGSSQRFRFEHATAAAHPLHVRDARYGWRLQPGQRITLQTGGADPSANAMRTNSHGFRGGEFEDYKPPDVMRILFVGDSNPMGFGIANDEATYAVGVARLLDRHLGGRTGFESINLGVDGYSSFQARRVVEDFVPRLDPDVVCIQVGFNDHTLSAVPDSAVSFDRPAILDALEQAHAYRWLRRQLLILTRQHERTFDPVPRVSVAGYEANLRDMIERAQGAGATVVLITTPARPGMPLVINEVPLSTESGVTWVIQDRWFEDRVTETGVPVSLADAGYRRVAEEAIRAQPEWPLPHFKLAEVLEAGGDTVGAAAARVSWQARDHERTVLEQYNDVVREVGREEGAVVIEVSGVLIRAMGTDDPDRVDALYLDFVHLDERGNIALAQAIAEELGRRLR